MTYFGQPYRSLGLGTFVIKHLLEAASSPSAKPRITALYLHVQISNDGAKRFYERNGFKEVSIVESYYKKIEPKAAWLMEWETPPLPPAANIPNADVTPEEKPVTGKAHGKGGKKGKGR